MAPDLKAIIRDNVRALLGLKPGQSGVSKLIDLGIANGNAQRVLGGKTRVGLDVLSQVAAALSVEPWQLCVPALDPTHLPSLEPVAFRWPFRQIDPDVITGLVGTSAQGVENGLLAVLAALGIAPRKQSRVA